MAIALNEYIQAKGFRADPFATSSAEEEVELLPSLFVQTDVFPNLANTSCTILFAPPGHGKTSHRMEVARLAWDRTPHELAVTFVGFDVFIARGVDQIGLTDYVDVLRRVILQTLHDLV